jgi:hypothetical protein
MTIAVFATVITLAPGTAGLLVVALFGLAYRIGRDSRSR